MDNNLGNAIENEETRVLQAINEENMEEVVIETAPPLKKKKNIFLKLMNVIATLLLLFVIFETVIAFMNFNLIQNKEEPKYFVTKSFKDEGTTDYTIWSMRLYRIVRKDTPENYEIRLLPFFLEI